MAKGGGQQRNRGVMGAREGAGKTEETEGFDGEGRHEGLDVDFF